MAMKVKSAKIELLIEDSFSLKDKRRVIKSIMSKLRNKFNISIAEVGSNELHNKAELGVSMVGNDYRFLDTAMDNVLKFIEENYQVEVIYFDEV